MTEKIKIITDARAASRTRVIHRLHIGPCSPVASNRASERGVRRSQISIQKGTQNFSLSYSRDKTKNSSLCFYAELKIYNFSYSIYKDNDVYRLKLSSWLWIHVLRYLLVCHRKHLSISNLGKTRFSVIRNDDAIEVGLNGHEKVL